MKRIALYILALGMAAYLAGCSNDAGTAAVSDVLPSGVTLSEITQPTEETVNNNTESTGTSGSTTPVVATSSNGLTIFDGQLLLDSQITINGTTYQLDEGATVQVVYSDGSVINIQVTIDPNTGKINLVPVNQGDTQPFEYIIITIGDEKYQIPVSQVVVIETPAPTDDTNQTETVVADIIAGIKIINGQLNLTPVISINGIEVVLAQAIDGVYQIIEGLTIYAVDADGNKTAVTVTINQTTGEIIPAENLDITNIDHFIIEVSGGQYQVPVSLIVAENSGGETDADDQDSPGSDDVIIDDDAQIVIDINKLLEMFHMNFAKLIRYLIQISHNPWDFISITDSNGVAIDIKSIKVDRIKGEKGYKWGLILVPNGAINKDESYNVVITIGDKSYTWKYKNKKDKHHRHNKHHKHHKNHSNQ